MGPHTRLAEPLYAKVAWEIHIKKTNQQIRFKQDEAKGRIEKTNQTSESKNTNQIRKDESKDESRVISLLPVAGQYLALQYGGNGRPDNKTHQKTCFVLNTHVLLHLRAKWNFPFMGNGFEAIPAPPSPTKQC